MSSKLPTDGIRQDRHIFSQEHRLQACTRTFGFWSLDHLRYPGMSEDILGYPELSWHIPCYWMSRVILGYTFTQMCIQGYPEISQDILFGKRFPGISWESSWDILFQFYPSIRHFFIYEVTRIIYKPLKVALFVYKCTFYLLNNIFYLYNGMLCL